MYGIRQSFQHTSHSPVGTIISLPLVIAAILGIGVVSHKQREKQALRDNQARAVELDQWYARQMTVTRDLPENDPYRQTVRIMRDAHNLSTKR
jgi:hypothetical protein